VAVLESLGARERSDEELVLAIGAGDTESLGVLVGRWEQPLHRFVHRMLPRADDAADVCQETFLRVLRRADRFQEGSRFSTWLYQIALNLCRDHARRKRRWRLVVDDDASADDACTDGRSDATDAERSVERLETRRLLTRVMARLPEAQREVLILKEFEGLKFKEIAALLGCPESTVKSRLYGGLSAMREALDAEGLGPSIPRRNGGVERR
jgi:RNA polymerase sigma-70 factor (ECF subfamily)